MRRWLLPTLAVGVAAGLLLMRPAPSATPDSPAVVHVGTLPVSEADLQARARVEAVLVGQEADARDIALVNLVQGRLAEALLDRIGERLTDDELRWEEQRVDRDTKAPQQIRRIKDLFEGEPWRYRTVYLRPALARRKLYATFSQRPEFHRREREAVEAVCRAPTVEAFERGAAVGGVEVQGWHVSREYGIRRLGEDGVPRVALGFIGRENDVKTFQTELTETLLRLTADVPAGAPVPSVHETPDAFHAFFVVDKPDGAVVCRVARMPRRSFDDFMQELAADVPIEFVNLELRETFLGRIAWASKLHIVPPPSSPDS